MKQSAGDQPTRTGPKSTSSSASRLTFSLVRLTASEHVTSENTATSTSQVHCWYRRPYRWRPRRRCLSSTRWNASPLSLISCRELTPNTRQLPQRAQDPTRLHSRGRREALQVSTGRRGRSSRCYQGQSARNGPLGSSSGDCRHEQGAEEECQEEGEAQGGRRGVG